MLKKLGFRKENRFQNIRRSKAVQRQATFETLERREVFSIAMWAPERTANQWADMVVASWTNSQRGDSSNGSWDTTPRFASEQDAKTQLKEMISQHWKDFFGASVDKGFVDRFAPIYEPIDYVVFLDSLSRIEQYSLSDYSRNASTITVNQNFQPIPTKNNQISGVDEGDITAFTDGYAIVLAENKIRVIDTRDPKEIKTVAIVSPHGYAQSIHVKGNRMMVGSITIPTFGEGAAFVSYRSTVTMYDIGDKATPRELEKVELDGEIVSTRWSGDEFFVSMRRQVNFPQPRFISSVSSDYKSKEIGTESIGRFETETEFWTRVSDQQVLDLFLPSISENGNAQQEIGDWKDLIQLTDKPSFNQTIASVFDTSSGALKLIDSEILIGLQQNFAHSDENSIYYFQQQRSANVWDATGMVDVEFDRSKGELAFHGTATVPGNVRDSRMVDEYEGMLRVFSEEMIGINWFNNDPLGTGGNRHANLTILQFDGDRGKKIGELIDIAGGQSLISAEFAGPRAVITTAVPVSAENPFPFDPLHGIDLSNPAEPKELSELTIPGFTTYLHWIDDTHLIGIGYTQRTNEPNSDWVYQLSLYDVSDLSSPKVLETWTGTEQVFPNFQGFGIASLAIEYNPTTKILSVPFQAAALGMVGFGPEVASASLFRLNPGAEDKIQQVGRIKQDFRVDRVSVQSDYVFALSREHLNSYHISDVVHPIDSLKIAYFAPYISLTQVKADRPIHELDATLRSLEGKIVSVKNMSGAPDQIVISNDGKALDLKLSDQFGLQRYVNFHYEIESIFGEKFTGVIEVEVIREPTVNTLSDTVTVQAGGRVVVDIASLHQLPADAKVQILSNGNWGANVMIVEGNKISYRAADSISQDHAEDFIPYTVTTSQGVYTGNLFVVINPQATTKADLYLVAVDENGDELSQVSPGQEFWLELRGSDLRENPEGIFSAYANVDFSSSDIEVNGDVSGGKNYTYRVRGIVGRTGIVGWGAVSNSSSPLGNLEEPIVRIPMKANAVGSWTATLSKSLDGGNEVLVFGSNFSVLDQTFRGLTLKVVDSSTKSSAASVGQSDLNQDGFVTPLDALILINYLNESTARSNNVVARSVSSDGSNSKFDINSDGRITAIDALQVINLLNSHSGNGPLKVTGSQVAEGEASEDLLAMLASDLHRKMTSASKV